jgi:hypothetical protein
MLMLKFYFYFYFRLEADDNVNNIDHIVFCTFLDKDKHIYERLLPIIFPKEAPTIPEGDGGGK